MIVVRFLIKTVIKCEETVVLEASFYEKYIRYTLCAEVVNQKWFIVKVNIIKQDM